MYYSRALKFIFLLLIFSSLKVHASDVSFEGLQAVYIHKFSNYIEWPKQKNSNFVVAVLDNPEIYQAMRELFEGKLIDNRPAIILNLKKIDKNERYDILHINEMDGVLIKEIKPISEQDILIISQDPQGLNEYVSINFFLETDGKLRFDINLSRANQNHLKINSRLLNLARNLK